MSTALPTPRSLRFAAEAAAALGEPLVVMTSLAGCPWCDMVRDHHLGPMLRKNEVVAVQIDIRDRQTPLQNFEGQISTAAEQARLWKARFAPTVLFLGPQGQELAERLVGMAVPEFYASYLQARLEEARGRLTRR